MTGTPAVTDALDAGSLPLGATPLPGARCGFRVWAPLHDRLELVLDDGGVRDLGPADRRGYFAAVVDDVRPGVRYRYRLSGGAERPDPASRHQPSGVDGPSEVVELEFAWGDDHWQGLRLADFVFYELHVGTFTPAGGFDGVAAELPRLRELGVTAIELMPVAQFPGGRNWGYDGVFPFAVQNTYGGPAALQRLVDACHAAGLAVVLDVVYNHLGPEGNYLAEFGPYFNSAYRTPWGDAVNFDAAGSDEVRRYFVDNALSWLRDFHVDALRLDAVHAIMDRSARPFLRQLAEEVDALSAASGWRRYLIAESDLNTNRLTRRRSLGGMGLDAQWADDFHHAVHAHVTGERQGYYRDYGELSHIRDALERGWVFTGQYSEHRGRSHGEPPADTSGARFVVAIQNHDQVGNRMRGDRLSALVEPDVLRVAAAANLLSPFLPLLFMGEEYAETAPFPYFVSHSDPELVAAVREGRAREFDAFQWEGAPPDPQAEETFRAAVPEPTRRHGGEHARMYAWYRSLIDARRAWPELAGAAAPERQVEVISTAGGEPVLRLERRAAGARSLLLLRFGGEAAGDVALPDGAWRVVLDSRAETVGGEEGKGGPSGGSPETIVGTIAVMPRHALLLLDADTPAVPVTRGIE